MRITKFGHACVRIEHAGGTLVLDPGVFTDPEALDGADAVLITHEHPDHYLPAHLSGSDAPVFTIAAVAERIRSEVHEAFERTTVVAPGESFTVTGLPITAVGERHIVIHPELPQPDNSGYLIEIDGQRLFHPGDELTGPGQEIDLLFLPVSAPWARSADLIDFARGVGAPRNVAIHDRIYSAAGSGTFDTQINALLPEQQSYTRLTDGADL